MGCPSESYCLKETLNGSHYSRAHKNNLVWKTTFDLDMNTRTKIVKLCQTLRPLILLMQLINGHLP